MKEVNVILFGMDDLGSSLINQLLEQRPSFKKAGFEIGLPLIASSQNVFVAQQNKSLSWEMEAAHYGNSYKMKDILKLVRKRGLKNPVVVDATQDSSFPDLGLLRREGFRMLGGNRIPAVPAAQTTPGKGPGEKKSGRREGASLKASEANQAATNILSELIKLAENLKE